ncbi:MAG: hypothetical protein KBA46_07255, partial [Candidatus Omnitrophica bacterium]|nr:hypothetical protein [Candidatus Omnitrophota bacterium]
VKQIEPDLVILQVSSNDFWDNVRQLDIAILVIRKYMRLYYIAQRMEYHTPHSFQLMQGPLGNLRVARVVYYQLQRLRIDKKYAILNGHIESQGIQHEGLQASLQVTSELMQKIKQLVNDIPLVVFLADDRMPYNAQWKNICDRQGILFIDGIASAVDAHEAWGLSCKISDRIHWNEQGQQIAGELLARHLAAFLSRHGSDKKVFPDTLKQ